MLSQLHSCFYSPPSLCFIQFTQTRHIPCPCGVLCVRNFFTMVPKHPNLPECLSMMSSAAGKSPLVHLHFNLHSIYKKMLLSGRLDTLLYHNSCCHSLWSHRKMRTITRPRTGSWHLQGTKDCALRLLMARQRSLSISQCSSKKTGLNNKE